MSDLDIREEHAVDLKGTRHIVVLHENVTGTITTGAGQTYLAALTEAEARLHAALDLRTPGEVR